MYPDKRPVEMRRAMGSVAEEEDGTRTRRMVPGPGGWYQECTCTSDAVDQHGDQSVEVPLCRVSLLPGLDSRFECVGYRTAPACSTIASVS